MKSLMVAIALALAIASTALATTLTAACTTVRTFDVDGLHRPFDEILDSLRARWARLLPRAQAGARQARSLRAALGEVTAETVKSWPRERQLAYWINAYNAFVLRTVIDALSDSRQGRRTIHRTAFRQIPGAFERRQFRAGGRMLTLDAIEKDVIGEFSDARALLALGRGAIGGPRLKSEAFTAARLDSQLHTMASELVKNRDLVWVDIPNARLSVNPLFSWREAIFTKSLAERAARGLCLAQSARAQRAGADRSSLVPNEAGIPPQEYVSHGRSTTSTGS